MENNIIQRLPNELLLQIFSYFPTLEEKLIIEQVCPRWQDLILSGAPILNNLIASPSSTCPLTKFKVIIQGCGRYLTQICIEVGASLESELGLVAQNCPSLKTLFLRLLPQSTRVIRTNAEVLTDIFSNLPHLRAVHFEWMETRRRFFFRWNSVHALPHQTSELSFHGHEHTFPLGCSVDLSHFTHLSKLAIRWFSVGINLRHVTNITDLILSECSIENPTLLDGIAYLRNLRNLNISDLTCLTFNDQMMKRIIENCNQITEWHLIGIHPDELTDHAFEHVHQLAALQVLELQDFNSRTSAILSRMLHLQELYVRDCQSVNGNDVISFINNAPDLFWLEFSPHDWRQSIPLVNSFMEARLKPLTLLIDEEWATMDWVETQELSPLLRIVCDDQ